MKAKKSVAENRVKILREIFLTEISIMLLDLRKSGSIDIRTALLQNRSCIKEVIIKKIYRRREVLQQFLLILCFMLQ